MIKNLLVLAIILFIESPIYAGNKKDKQFSKGYIKKVMKEPQHGNSPIQNNELTFYAGVMAAYETTRSKKIYNALIEMGEKNQWKPGTRLHHADDHVICQTYIDGSLAR